MSIFSLFCFIVYIPVGFGLARIVGSVHLCISDGVRFPSFSYLRVRVFLRRNSWREGSL